MKSMKIFMLILFLLVLPVSAIQPGAPDNYTIVDEETQSNEIGSMLNTSGGSITTLTINTTTQNFRWKGFVGNISGRLILSDSNSQALFDWQISTITGEIYATRNESLINWDAIKCASEANVSNEENALNIDTDSPDSINNTFDEKTHDEFYVGNVRIAANSCKSVALNVEGKKQDTDFREVLLSDDNSLIYSSLLENSKKGFDSMPYDFQIILAENALQGQQPNTPYYFYVELI